MSFPEVTERLSHGSPTWFVRGKSTFVSLMEDGHHQNQFPHLWCAAPPGVQGELVEAEPDRFFKPPYVGGRGWLGVRLDVPIDWDEMTLILEDAYRVDRAEEAHRRARRTQRLDVSPWPGRATTSC